jgi:phenylacetate-CoA ligase
MNHRLADEKLEKQLAGLVQRVTATTPFYRKKYRGIELEPFTMELFTRLPFFYREEYRQREELDDLYCPQQESHYVFISGGSTGISKASFWNTGYIDRQITTLARTFQQLGLTSQDRALNLFNPGMSGTHYGFNLAMEKIGTTIIPLGGDTPLPVIARFIEDMEVNVLIGNPATLILALEHLVAREPDFSLKMIIYAGENLSQVQGEFMKQHARHIYSPIYSSTETGIIGTQCPSIPAATFHLDDTVYVELLDPVTGALSAANRGEIVVTSLLERAAPCLRYRLGDQITFLDAPCVCGNPAPLFKLEGRLDDAITIGSTNWSYDEIVAPLLQHFGAPPPISSNVCLHLEEKERKVLMILQYQARQETGAEQISGIETRIWEFMNREHAIVAPLVQKQLIYPVEVQRIASFETLRHPQTGKIRFVVDKRRKALKLSEC